jgi:hypothetical protein
MVVPPDVLRTVRRSDAVNSAIEGPAVDDLEVMDGLHQREIDLAGTAAGHRRPKGTAP